MAEKDTVFSSSVKYNGIFSFSDFYQFCHDWLTQETGLRVSEKKYSEKLSGDSKNIDIDWEGTKKITDYFKMEIKVVFQIQRLSKVEINQSGAKVETNKGTVQVKVTGTLIKDYEGRFATTAFKQFIREIYERWVINSRVDQMQGMVAQSCDEFLAQAKAYLDLEGKK